MCRAVLEEIGLRRLGVIEDAALALHPGLTVVTGETGAGKTMVVTALMLLQGGRADPGLVRHGADQARVEGRVSVKSLPGVRLLVDEAGGEVEDGAVLVARTLGAAGRSRAHLGGASVPASVLATLGNQLVAVHGQADQLRLRQPGAPREALDRFAGAEVASLLERYHPAYRRLAQVGRELATLHREDDQRAGQLDRLRLGLDEIAVAAPRADEDEELRHEEDRLAHAEALQLAAAEARCALAGQDDQAITVPDTIALLARARAALEGVRGHDPDAGALADRVAELAYAASDLASDLTSYTGGIDLDPLRLAAVQERRATLGVLARRYGPTLSDVLSWAANAQGQLVHLEQAADTGAALESERETLLVELGTLASALTTARHRAAAALSAAVTDELTALAMPHASLHARVRAVGDGPVTQRLGPDGVDEVELLLAANAAAPPRPLGRSASGGELSRVMLALEVVLAATTPVPTYVFDEVDAGIGGKAAVEVGRRLSRLARHAQVLVVTHLPQVAAFADRHYLVDKSDDGTITTSGVHVLDGAARVRELSRMLAGVEDSVAAKAHAEELLELAARDR
ncbi:MAG: DNA repair protein RecN [Nocardioidaceae bacterium]|nr:DNA repair protein RecN [Nocardioidaceae bacterium]